DALRAAGDSGRLAIADQRRKEGKHLEVVRELKDVQPSFDRFPHAQLFLALSALEVDKEAAQRGPNKEEAEYLSKSGQRSFKAIALEALARIPDPAPTAKPDVNVNFLRSKYKEVTLYTADKKFDQVMQLCDKVLARLEDLTMPKGINKSDFRTAFVKMRTYAVYSLAADDDKAGRYAAAATKLDPLVKELGDNKLPEVKEDTRLTNGILGLALRGNILAQQLSQAKVVLDVWKKIDPNPEAASGIIKQIIVNFHK